MTFCSKTHRFGAIRFLRFYRVGSSDNLFVSICHSDPLVISFQNIYDFWVVELVWVRSSPSILSNGLKALLAEHAVLGFLVQNENFLSKMRISCTKLGFLAQNEDFLPKM